MLPVLQRLGDAYGFKFAFLFVTGSIAHSAKRRHLCYSEADFNVFRPAGGNTLHDGVKSGAEEAKVPSSVPNFFPIGAMIRV